MGPIWTIIPLDYWMYIWCWIVGIFIILEIIFYLSYWTREKKIINVKKSKTEYINGKQIHNYTYPPGLKGGIFSKTYIEIDDDNVLRLRSLMIPPGDLWTKK